MPKTATDKAKIIFLPLQNENRPLRKKNTYQSFNRLLVITLMMGQLVYGFLAFSDSCQTQESQIFMPDFEMQMGQHSADPEVENEDFISLTGSPEKALLPFVSQRVLIEQDDWYYFHRDISSPPPEYLIFS